jgi:hypothetical protein
VVASHERERAAGLARRSVAVDGGLVFEATAEATAATATPGTASADDPSAPGPTGPAGPPPSPVAVLPC